MANYCYVIFERFNDQGFFREFIAPDGKRQYHTLREARTVAKSNNVVGTILKYDFLRGYDDREFCI